MTITITIIITIITIIITITITLTELEDADGPEDTAHAGRGKRSMSVIGKILAVMDMESHDVKMESI